MASSSKQITNTEIDTLLEAARDVPYVYAALLDFSENIDPESDTTRAAFEKAIAGRRAVEFTNLYVACGMAGQLPGAWVLAEGVPLFVELNVLLQTILDLDGDLTSPVVQAVNSGRLTTEREGMLLLSLCFLRERDGVTAVDLEVLKAQRRCALGFRKSDNLGVASSIMEMVGSLSGDPDLLRLMGYEQIERSKKLAPGIGGFRDEITKTVNWRKLIPSSLAGESISAGATITRIAPRVGRNDPCHCGSGKKYKKCCSGKADTGSSYAVEGQVVDEIKSNPELRLLDVRSVYDLRPYELFQLDPCRLVPGIFETVIERLVLFRENTRAREMIEAVDPARIDDYLLDRLEFDFLEAEDDDSLRWLFSRRPYDHEPCFATKVRLAPREEALRLVLEKIRSAQQEHAAKVKGARVTYTEVATGGAMINPELGLILARGSIPFVDAIHFEFITEIIDQCRIELGLTGADPGIDWMDEDDESELREAEHQFELEQQQAQAEERVAKRKREAELLKTRLRSLQSELEKREKPAAPRAGIPSETAPPITADLAKIEALREQARMLKGNLKQEHDDHARDREALRQAQQELHRIKSKPSQARDPKETEQAAKEELHLGETVEPMHDARLPEYAPTFRNALSRLDNRIVANAISLAGKLAAADAHAWRGVRKLRGRPDTLRQKVGRSYRLLFKADNEKIEFVDLINRRDLDDWIRR